MEFVLLVTWTLLTKGKFQRHGTGVKVERVARPERRRVGK